MKKKYLFRELIDLSQEEARKFVGIQVKVVLSSNSRFIQWYGKEFETKLLGTRQGGIFGEINAGWRILRPNGIEDTIAYEDIEVLIIL